MPRTDVKQQRLNTAPSWRGHERFSDGAGARGTAEAEDVWHIFHCLALACSVCARGNEDMTEPAWDHDIAHLDLKPTYVCIGAFDGAHARMPIFQVSLGIDSRSTYA